MQVCVIDFFFEFVFSEVYVVGLNIEGMFLVFEFFLIEFLVLFQ